MLKVMDMSNHSEIVKMGDIVDDCVDNIGSIESNFIRSGFKDLNELIGGFAKTNVVILAARPGQGKSSFMLNLASDMSDKYL